MTPPKRQSTSPFWRYRRLFFLVGLLLATGIAGAAYVLVRVPLPPEHQQAQTTFLTDATGQHLATLSNGVNRVFVPLDKVPPVVVNAVVDTEDRTYFKHGGVDPVGILRAVFSDLRGSGNLQGGSTITQQYVKNVYLGQERTISRKLKEAALAVKLERKLSKRQILERYLNSVYFGRGAYGVQAASQEYFGKDVGALGLREAAYLAGLIRAPVNADALQHPAVADSRRNRTLLSMQRAGHISGADRSRVAAQPVASYVVTASAATSTYAAADKGTQYFVDSVRQQLLSRYPEQTVYGGGLRVKTTIDLRMQAQAYDAVYGLLDQPGDPAGALVAVDANGQVKAMVGGRDFNASKVNLALGSAGGGSGRQPGSTFKAFVLAELVREGYSINSTLPAPDTIVFPKGNRGKDYPIDNFEGEHFDHPINIIDATKQSVNTVYAQLIDTVGPDKVADLAHKMGVTATLSPDISLTLGTSEVSPLDMASAYETLSNRGEHVAPVTILEVQTADGHVLERARFDRARVLPAKTADIVNYCLQQVVQSGTGTGAQIGRPVAGKTGTTEDYGDAWFVGYTPKLTTAVWMGYPEGRAHAMTNVRGKKVAGGSFPATIFKRFMTQAVRDGDYGGAFAPTPSFDGRTVPVPTNVQLPTTTTSSSSTTSTSTSTTAPPTTTTTGPKKTTTTSSSTSSTTTTTRKP